VTPGAAARNIAGDARSTSDKETAMESRIILPLDNLPWNQARDIITRTSGRVWGYKIRRAVLDRGLGVLADIRPYGRVMLDFKLYDIPSAMTESLRQHLSAGADITTVHCTAGYDPAAEGLSGDNLAGVTVLTSIGPEHFSRYYRGASIAAMVAGMAREAAGRYGYLVCSARELRGIDNIPIKKICPGIRPAWYTRGDDQQRTATPADAIRAGAHLLVIGRPLLEAEDIRDALARTNQEIASALQPGSESPPATPAAAS